MDDASFTVPGPSASISQAPVETRWFIARLASLTVFYILVRGWLSGRTYLRRLAYVLLINAFALSLFGLARYFGPFPNRLPWLDPSEVGSPFSAFINRNHFAFYINLCLGLGMGLLFQDSKSSGVYKAARRRGTTRWQDRLVDTFSGLFAILQNPRALWIISLLTVCLLCVPLSKSRGGAVAFLAAATVTAVVWSRVAGGDRKRVPIAVLAPFILAASFAIWYSWGALASRIDGDLNSLDDRSAIWRDSLRLLPSFGIFGAGAGAFVWVEPMRRGDETKRVFFDHAHNEYLEAAVEGGLPRLAITLALVYFAFRFAIRACRVHGRGKTGPLAFGCLFGLTAAAVHSFFEFGIHLGSIAMLTAALAACASSLATDYSSTDKQQNDKQQKSSSGRGYALSVALLFPPLCALLGWQSYVQWRAETFAAEAYKERTRPLTSVSAERRKAFSAAAATAAPSDVEILVLRGVCLTDASRLPELDPAESRALVDEAVKVWLTARAASPYHPRPHALLGAYRYALKTGDAPLVYFERARFLQPTDPDMHYFCGMEYWKAGRDAEALQSWQRSLELSPDRYKEILTAAAARLGPQRLAEEIVPDQPNMLRDAANFLYPDAHADAAGRLPFLAKAARLYDASPEPADGRSLYEMGRIYGELGQGQKAVDAMRKATRRNPDRTEWRIELALQHRANRDFKEAVAELRRVLQDDSTSVEARKWFEFVKREVALRSAEGPD